MLGVRACVNSQREFLQSLAPPPHPPTRPTGIITIPLRPMGIVTIPRACRDPDHRESPCSPTPAAIPTRGIVTTPRACHDPGHRVTTPHACHDLDQGGRHDTPRLPRSRPPGSSRYPTLPRIPTIGFVTLPHACHDPDQGSSRAPTPATIPTRWSVTIPHACHEPGHRDRHDTPFLPHVLELAQSGKCTIPTRSATIPAPTGHDP